LLHTNSKKREKLKDKKG